MEIVKLVEVIHAIDETNWFIYSNGQYFPSEQKNMLDLYINKGYKLVGQSTAVCNPFGEAKSNSPVTVYHLVSDKLCNFYTLEKSEVI
jgi:hypothetical protein